MNKEPRTMQVADAATASRAPENTAAMVKKIGKTTYKVHVHFSNTSTETMSDKIKRISPDTKPLSAPTRTDTITLATFMCISS